MENFIILNKNEIKKIRQKEGYTQFQMAYFLKIDIKTYNRKENGKTSFTLEEYAKIIDILYNN